MSILKSNMPVAICCDHAGFDTKQAVIEYFKQNGIEYKDFGTYNTDSCDYPDFAHPCAEAVEKGECYPGGRVGEVYNVGGHNEKQNIEIVKIICKELGKPESLITHVGDRKGHDMRYAIDPTKIHNELGWLPETKFEDGIKKTIRWYLDNKQWWQTIISGEYQNYYEKMYSNR